jgi:hypothetical protein
MHGDKRPNYFSGVFPFRGLKPHGYRQKVAPRRVSKRPPATPAGGRRRKALITSVFQTGDLEE